MDADMIVQNKIVFPFQKIILLSCNLNTVLQAEMDADMIVQNKIVFPFQKIILLSCYMNTVLQTEMNMMI